MFLFILDNREGGVLKIMFVDDHVRSSREKFGKSFSEVHFFLDQYFKRFGPSHRILLHHQKGVELVVKQFGEEAKKPAELHIQEDVGCLPEDWHSYGDPVFINLELYDDLEAELKILYPDDFG